MRLLHQKQEFLTENMKTFTSSGKLGFPKMQVLAMWEIFTCMKIKFWQKKVKITAMTAYVEIPLIFLNHVAFFCTPQ